MRRFAQFGLALMLVGAFSIVSVVSASAESTPLPQISTALPGETYPIIGEGAVKAENEDDFFSTASFQIPDEETRVKLEVTMLGSSGVGEVELRGVREGSGGERCNTSGDASGVVLVKGEFHLVYTSISPASTLEVGTLLTFNTFKVLCGALISTIEGPLLGRVIPEAGGSADGGDSTSLKLAFHCSNTLTGTQELSSYYNSEGTLITKQLMKANISGLGLENGCKELAPEATGSITSSSLARMFTILY